MKRDRDDDRDGGLVGEKMFRGDGPRGGRGRSRGGRGGSRRPPSRGLEYAGYDYSQGYEVPIHDPDEVELKADIEVRREMVGPVIGRQGQTVTQIRKDTGAQIHIRDSVPGETDQVIEIKGTRNQIEEAYQQIRQVVTNEDEDYGFHHPGIRTALILVHIAPEMVGCLIGKGGKNVKMIKEDTGANIRVDAQVDNQPFQTVNITGDIQASLDAYARVSDCLRSFDPKKAKMLRGVDDHSPISTVSIPQNQMYNASANFGAGLVGVNPVAAADPNQAFLAPGQQQQQQQQQQPQQQPQQQAFVVQGPMQAPGGPPPILVLQPDGTYLPAPVIYQPLPQNQTPGNPVQFSTSVSVGQDLTGGTPNLTSVTVPQFQYAQAPVQAGQASIMLPSGGAMIHTPTPGIMGAPAQGIVGIQPGGLAVSAGATLASGVISQQP